MNYLNRQIQDFIQNHAKADFPKEACGIIVEKDSAAIAIKCDNMSINPEESFLLSIPQVKKFAQNFKIVGYYHSHPKDNPVGDIDIMVSEKTKLNCIMFNCVTNQFSEYIPKGIFISYLNRPFLYGIFDCLTLIIDYYQNQLNLKVNDIDHPHRINPYLGKDVKAPILKEHFINNGFQEAGTLKKHDVILTKTYQMKTPTHCLVYLGENKILHHPAGQFSLKEEYNNSLKQRAVHILRHKALI